jgi:lipopolysaccharide transport system ATP-binding protein
MSETAVKVENLGKSYRLGTIGTRTLKDDLFGWFSKTGSKQQREENIIWALKEIDFEVKRGEAVGIVGKNGAGKSTLLKLLSRTTAPSTGSIKLKGKIASLLEVGTGFHPELSGRENVFLNGAIMGMTRNDIKHKFDEIVAFSGVSRFIDTPVKRYSSGMYVRLAFAVAAHLESEIMIIDEVLAVGDVDFQKKCIGKMREVSGNEGRTVLFVSHNMASVKHLCTTGLFLEGGRLKMAGTVDRITDAYTQANKQLIEQTALSERTDRSGSGAVRFVDFRILDRLQNPIATILSGEDVIFSFILKSGKEAIKNMDLGFSLQDSEDHLLTVLYGSYQKAYFDADGNELIEIQCMIRSFPFSQGKYKVGARVLVNNEEADFPSEGIAYLDVENGDFFHSGHIGFGEHGQSLIKGDWAANRLL